MHAASSPCRQIQRRWGRKAQREAEAGTQHVQIEAPVFASKFDAEFKVGQLAAVIEPFFKPSQAASSGYLALQQGDHVNILYVGDSQHSEHYGWLYGELSHSSLANRVGERGWFPQSAVSAVASIETATTLVIGSGALTMLENPRPSIADRATEGAADEEAAITEDWSSVTEVHEIHRASQVGLVKQCSTKQDTFSKALRPAASVKSKDGMHDTGVHDKRAAVPNDLLVDFGSVLKETWQIINSELDEAFSAASLVHALSCGVSLTANLCTPHVVGCAHCGKYETGMKKCGQCKLVQYCSKECQALHWSCHKCHCMTVKEHRDITFSYDSSLDPDQANMYKPLEAPLESRIGSLTGLAVNALVTKGRCFDPPAHLEFEIPLDMAVILFDKRGVTCVVRDASPEALWVDQPWDVRDGHMKVGDRAVFGDRVIVENPRQNHFLTCAANVYQFLLILNPDAMREGKVPRGRLAPGEQVLLSRSHIARSAQSFDPQILTGQVPTVMGKCMLHLCPLSPPSWQDAAVSKLIAKDSIGGEPHEQSQLWVDFFANGRCKRRMIGYMLVSSIWTAAEHPGDVALLHVCLNELFQCEEKDFAETLAFKLVFRLSRNLISFPFLCTYISKELQAGSLVLKSFYDLSARPLLASWQQARMIKGECLCSFWSDLCGHVKDMYSQQKRAASLSRLPCLDTEKEKTHALNNETVAKVISHLQKLGLDAFLSGPQNERLELLQNMFSKVTIQTLQMSLWAISVSRLVFHVCKWLIGVSVFPDNLSLFTSFRTAAIIPWKMVDSCTSAWFSMPESSHYAIMRKLKQTLKLSLVLVPHMLYKYNVQSVPGLLEAVVINGFCCVPGGGRCLAQFEYFWQTCSGMLHAQGDIRTLRKFLYRKDATHKEFPLLLDEDLACLMQFLPAFFSNWLEFVTLHENETVSIDGDLVLRSPHFLKHFEAGSGKEFLRSLWKSPAQQQFKKEFSDMSPSERSKHAKVCSSAYLSNFKLTELATGDLLDHGVVGLIFDIPGFWTHGLMEHFLEMFFSADIVCEMPDADYDNFHTAVLQTYCLVFHSAAVKIRS